MRHRVEGHRRPTRWMTPGVHRRGRRPVCCRRGCADRRRSRVRSPRGARESHRCRGRGRRISNVRHPKRTCRITTCADPADRPPTLAVLRSVADLLAAEASRGKGTPGRHMVERQAVEAPADQIRRNRAPGRPWAATELFGSQATFAHDQAESIRVHQRGCTKRAARQLRCRRTRGHSDRRAGRGGAGSRLTEEC